MNLNRTALCAVMMFATLAGTGCSNKNAQDSAADAQEQAIPGATPDDVTTDVKVAVEGRITIPAPPALREEVEGVAPSDHHVWSPGYWRYDYVKTVYLWEPGYWQDRLVVAPFAPPPVREEVVELRYVPAGDFFWAPGYWRWTGATYAWAPGYWAPRVEGWGWVRPYWVNYGGRWECHAWGWERRTAGWGRDRDDWSRRDFSRHDREEWTRRNREGWSHAEVSVFDRREHEHRVTPTTVGRLASMPRPAHGGRPAVAQAPAARPSQPAHAAPAPRHEPKTAPAARPAVAHAPRPQVHVAAAPPAHSPTAPRRHS